MNKTRFATLAIRISLARASTYSSLSSPLMPVRLRVTGQAADQREQTGGATAVLDELWKQKSRLCSKSRTLATLAQRLLPRGSPPSDKSRPSL